MNHTRPGERASEPESTIEPVRMGDSDMIMFVDSANPDGWIIIDKDALEPLRE